jgi:pectate lyase
MNVRARAVRFPIAIAASLAMPLAVACGDSAGSDSPGGQAGFAPKGGSAGAAVAGASAQAGNSMGGKGAPLGGSAGSSGGSGQAGAAGSSSKAGSGGSAAGSAGDSNTGGATAGSAGVTGTAGSSSEPVDPSKLVGWAAVAGDGVDTTTGGAGGPVVEIRSAADMVTHGEDNTPKVLRIMNDITGEFDLGSNKTVEGATNDITITGSLGIVGKADAYLSNVIVRNLKINVTASEEDGMDIRYTHHVWVDHCEFFDGPDGNLDIVYESNYVTVSWTKFYYTANYHPAEGETEAVDHRFSNLVGNGNGMTGDRGRLRVTFHHNWWAEGVIERMPRVRFGEIHLFNNYYSSSGNNYAIGAGVEAKIVVENNFFENVNDPHIFYSGEKTAQIVANGNHYVNTTGLRDAGQGNAFSPPYPYTMENAPAVKATVMAHVGPR